MEWYPHYIGDFDADTVLLTAAEDGVYRRLISWYYLHERPLPNDFDQLARIGRVTRHEFECYASQIMGFFYVNGNGMLHHKRCDQVLMAQSKKRKDGAVRMEKMRQRGIKGGK